MEQKTAGWPSQGTPPTLPNSVPGIAAPCAIRSLPPEDPYSCTGKYPVFFFLWARHFSPFSSHLARLFSGAGMFRYGTSHNEFCCVSWSHPSASGLISLSAADSLRDKRQVPFLLTFYSPALSKASNQDFMMLLT